MKTAIGALVLCLFTACSTSDDSSTPRDASPDAAASGGSTTDGSDSGDDGSGGGSGSGDAGAEDTSDAGQDVDSGEPNPVCEGLDESTCKNTPGCIVLKGQQYSTGKYGFAGCAHWCAGSTSPTCGIAPDKSCWQFADACVPDGWKLIEFCSSPAQCTATADAAAE